MDDEKKSEKIYPSDSECICVKCGKMAKRVVETVGPRQRHLTFYHFDENTEEVITECRVTVFKDAKPDEET